MSQSSRRKFVLQTLVGALALSWKTSWAVTRKKVQKKAPKPQNMCRLTAEQEEGPYYIEGEALRSNVTEDRPGVPLILRVQLFDIKRCAPLQNASMEIWSCDAMGEYAGFDAMNFGAPPGLPPDGIPPHDRPDHGPEGKHPGPPPHHAASNDKTFLHGRQNTDEEGKLEFTTIYPGCYEGRVNHIHVRVRINGDEEAKGRIVHTGQIFFQEAVTDAIMHLPPYTEHKVKRTRAKDDHIFMNEHGEAAIADLQAVRPGSIAHGFIAMIQYGIDPDAKPVASSPGNS